MKILLLPLAFILIIFAGLFLENFLTLLRKQKKTDATHGAYVANGMAVNKKTGQLRAETKPLD